MAVPCRDCFTGTLHGDATPAGSVSTLHGLPVYIARPPSDSGTQPRGIVVIFTDIFGWKLDNTRALADAYACRADCLVYLPDFMDGAFPTEPRR